MQEDKRLLSKHAKLTKKELARIPEEQKTLYEKQAEAKLKRSINLLEHIRFAQKKYGKRPFSIVKEFFQLQRGDGKLTISDYFLYQLYNDEKFSENDKTKFVSERRHWPITRKCCDMSWSGLTEDKWLSQIFLKTSGIRVPETIAVIDKSLRSFGSTPKINSPNQLRDIIKKNEQYPIFAKPNEGLGSFGAFIITGGDHTNILLDQTEPKTYEKLFEDIIGEKTYLLQPFLKNHSSIEVFSKYLATVRTVNLVNVNSIVTPFSLIKIPSPTSIADNYWRKGNILADVDPKSGIIRRAIRGKGIDVEEIDTHPENGTKLVGLKLPDWNELIRINYACAQLFAPIRYQSLDIALTQHGPVVIEINTGGSFEIPQLASGVGFLTDEIREFFESCGFEF